MDRATIELARKEQWVRHKTPAVSTFGLVTTQHFAASDAGAKVPEEGGNAVDAVVTAALTLQIAAVADVGDIKAAKTVVMPRPFASPAMIGRRGDASVAMPDTSYPPAFAASAKC
ncbi:hypothetical protein G6L32_14495 [Agrobacterium tumefaciens]|uniref:hypothetical protein n=1 Tax=Agrobacterium tumefaciens TaxID=358 RepID=UPI001571CEA9|nr:hypothetical protein [Agrobacterium tumefaciens]